MHKDTTTTTIRIADNTLDVLDEWASIHEISRADVVRCVLGYFTTLGSHSIGMDGNAYSRITERLQVLAESQ